MVVGKGWLEMQGFAPTGCVKNLSGGSMRCFMMLRAQPCHIERSVVIRMVRLSLLAANEARLAIYQADAKGVSDDIACVPLVGVSRFDSALGSATMIGSNPFIVRSPGRFPDVILVSIFH